MHQLRSRGSMDFEEISVVVPWIEMAHDLGQVQRHVFVISHAQRDCTRVFEGEEEMAGGCFPSHAVGRRVGTGGR